jgi:hypothetical protein
LDPYTGSRIRVADPDPDPALFDNNFQEDNNKTIEIMVYPNFFDGRIKFRIHTNNYGSGF